MYFVCDACARSYDCVWYGVSELGAMAERNRFESCAVYCLRDYQNNEKKRWLTIAFLYGKDTSAVILPVEIQFFRQLNTGKISVSFFEIRRQGRNPEFF